VNSAAHQQFLKRRQQIDDRQTEIQNQLSEIRRQEMDTARNREAEEVVGSSLAKRQVLSAGGQHTKPQQTVWPS
jgi:hypothetical protein